jgi:CheY-like chemotaxis protein
VDRQEQAGGQGKELAMSETGPKGTILLMENDDGVARALRVDLEELGFKVLVANTVEQAKTLYLENCRNLSLILKDNHMDGTALDGTGLAFIRHVRDFEKRVRSDSPVPIMMLSAYDREEEETLREAVQQAGGNMLVAKPITFSVLGEVVTKLTDTKPIILLVEDEPALLAITQKILTTAGCSVIACPSAEEARRQYEESQQRGDKIHLCITDCFMGAGQFSGFDLVREIREKGDDMPIIMMSGRTTPDRKREVQSLPGNNAFIGKPFNTTEFLDIVDEAVQLSKRGHRR